MILREKMISNVKMTESVLGSQILYINHYLKNYDMPDDMDSANNPAFQQKALDIGKQWYEHHQSRIQQWLQNQQSSVPPFAK